MNMTPSNLKFTQTHEWIEFESDTTANIGISDFAQHELGDIVFVNLPKPGDTIEKGVAFSDVESVKAVSDIISPVSGIVLEVNEELLSSPEKINQDAYGSWFIKVENITEKSELMSAAEYDEFCKK